MMSLYLFKMMILHLKWWFPVLNKWAADSVWQHVQHQGSAGAIFDWCFGRFSIDVLTDFRVVSGWLFTDMAPILTQNETADWVFSDTAGVGNITLMILIDDNG